MARSSRSRLGWSQCSARMATVKQPIPNKLAYANLSFAKIPIFSKYWTSISAPATVGTMIQVLLAFIPTIGSVFKLHRDLALENLALRQQLAVYQRRNPRPQLRLGDRLFWVWLSRVWDHWRSALLLVKPETVIRWHRQGFKLFWTKLSRRKGAGRPTI